MNCETAEEGDQQMEIFYRLFLPPDFMKKEVNESVVFAMLKAAKNFQVSRRGIPPEPDFCFDIGAIPSIIRGRTHDFERLSEP